MSTTKNNEVKPTAQAKSKKVVKKATSPDTQKHLRPKDFSKVNLMKETKSEHSDITSVFLNPANKKQVVHLKNLIEKRMQREGIELQSIFTVLAETFEYNIYHVSMAAELFEELEYILMKNRTFIESFMTKSKCDDLLKYLDKVSSLLYYFDGAYEGVLFDYCKVIDGNINLSKALELQSKHAEKKIVNENVWLFDLEFEIPFEKLNEDEKVDRLKLFLEKSRCWSEEEKYFIPDHVIKYLEKAEALITQ